MEKKFVYFLSKFGFIDKETSITFQHIYKDIFNENNNINIFELSFHILLTFLNNITIKQKNFLCENLPVKFFEIRQKALTNKLRSILITNQLKYKMSLLKYLYIWKYFKNSKEKNKKSNKSINKFNKQNSFIANRNSGLKNSNTVYKVSLKNNNNKNNDNNKEKDIFSDINDLLDISSKYGFNNYLLNNTTTKNSNSKFNFISTNVNSRADLNKSNSRENSNNKIKKYKTFNNSKIINDINKSLDNKEEIEMKECTFKPKINNLRQSFNYSKINYKERNKEIQSIFDKLYKDNEKYELSKQKKALELDYLINKDLTFNPTINSKHLTKENSKENFETRIKTFLENKKEHSEKIRKKINKEFEENFSFTPKINNSSKMSKTNSMNSFFSKTLFDKKEYENNKEIPAYKRLYEESKLRNKKREEKRKEADEYITNLSNSKIKNCILDLNKINELYENKNKSKIREKTKNKVNKEEGITFKPALYKNKFIKNIFSNFYERNSKFLEDKENFINFHKKINNRDKIMSNEEKKKIVENVIGRLYNDSKNLSLTNNGCHRYIKSIKGNLNKNLNIYSSDLKDEEI